MKIYEFLKVKKVKCIDVSGMCLSKDKEYQLLGVTDKSCIINDDDGYEVFASIERFEPVLDNDMSKSDTKIDISENSVNAVNNVSNVIPTFKVGDKVYFPNMAEGKVLTLLDNKACHYPFFVDVANKVNNSLYELDSNGKTKYGNFTDVVVKATQENYELLCKLYPHIEFEQPPKEITGSDLCRAMLDKGWHLVPCVVSDISDSDALNNDNCCLVDEWWVGYFESDNCRYKYAVPFDPKTGIPLTEDVLNETINK